MKPKKTWILVADGARARVLVNDGPGKGLHPALDHDFAATHGRNSEIGTERPGKGNGGAKGTGHAKPSKVDWHQFAKDCFAQDVAAVLDKAAVGGKFDRLLLVAPPGTLGVLRKELKPSTLQCVTGEVNKDLTHLPDHDIEGHLKEVVRL